MNTLCPVLRSLRAIEAAPRLWSDLAGPPTAGVQVGERASFIRVIVVGSILERHGAV
jgi:hypothetical protein